MSPRQDAPRAAYEECLQIWRVAPYVLNKQSRTANKGLPSMLINGQG